MPQRQKQFLYAALTALAAAAVLWAALHWVLPLLAPFLAAFGSAFCLRRPSRFLERHLHISRRPAAALLLCLCSAAALCGLGLLGARLLVLGRLALARLPRFYAEVCEPPLLAAAGRLAAAAEGSRSVLLDGPGLLEGFSSALQRLCENLAGRLGSALARLPALMVPVAVTTVASAYFALDYDRVAAFFTARLPEKTRLELHRLKTQGVQTAGRLLRAYCALFLLTFVQLLAGFALLRVRQPAALALAVTLVDVLPVLGVGTVLLPWAGLCFLGGKPGFGAGLLALYAVVWAVRQVCEPRLVGRQLGLHPLASLFFMYAGLRLFGVAGMLVLPCAATVVWQVLRRRAPSGAGAGQPEKEPPAPEKPSGTGG